MLNHWNTTAHTQVHAQGKRYSESRGEKMGFEGDLNDTIQK